MQSDIIEEYGYNLEHDSRFYIDTVVNPNYAFTVFASQFVIEFIQENIKPECRYYLMDATFDGLPPGYYQLLIISIEYQNDVSITNFNLFDASDKRTDKPNGRTDGRTH